MAFEHLRRRRAPRALIGAVLGIASYLGYGILHPTTAPQESFAEKEARYMRHPLVLCSTFPVKPPPGKKEGYVQFPKVPAGSCERNGKTRSCHSIAGYDILRLIDVYDRRYGQDLNREEAKALVSRQQDAVQKNLNGGPVPPRNALMDCTMTIYLNMLEAQTYAHGYPLQTPGNYGLWKIKPEAIEETTESIDRLVKRVEQMSDTRIREECAGY